MTLTDEIKIPDDKMKANQAQYDLDREAAKISALLSDELDLGYKPRVVERLNLNILHWIKFLIKDKMKKTKTQGLLKWLRKIKEKNGKTVLLKDITNGEDRLLINYYQNFTDKRKHIFKILITVEKMTNFNNLFSKTGDSIINNFDFLKRFGTLYDLLLILLNEKISTLEAPKEQEEMINEIDELKDLVLLEKQNITKKKRIKKKKKKKQKKKKK